MSELRGASLFTINEHSLGGSLHLDHPTSSDNHIVMDASNYTSTSGTFSFWVKEHNKAHASDNTYISTGSSQTARIWIRKHTSGSNLDSKIKIAVNSVSFVSDAVILDNTGWYHHVVSIDTNQPTDANKIRYWINGIELTWETVGNLSDGQNLYFGYAQEINEVFYASGYGQDATYADFKYIDGKALLPSQFGELKYGIWVPKAFNTASTDTLVTNGLIANYELNSNADDTSVGGTTYNGTLSNVTFLPNNYGIANFNGSNGYISLPNVMNNITNTFSYSGWFNVTSSSSDHFIAFFASTNAPTFTNTNVVNFTPVHSSNNYYFDFGNINTSGQRLSGVSPEAWRTGWHHLVVSKSSTTITIYVDGAKFRTASSSGTVNITSAARLGNYTSNYANGKMGQVRLFNIALSSTQALQEYNATKHQYTYGLNGWHLPLSNTSTGSIDSSSNLKLHLDASDSSSYGGSGTTWSDLTSNSNNGTISGANFLSTTNGGVFDFDGNNDSVQVDTLAGITNYNFTMSIWVNTTDTLAYYVSFRDPIYITFGSVYSSNSVGMGIYDGTNQYFINNTAMQGIDDGKWHHVVLTHDGTNLVGYIDGNIIATVSTGTTTHHSGGTNHNRIGMRGDGVSTTYDFNGKVAQFRIYNKALTAQEVITNYRATQGNYEQVSLVDISGNVIGASTGGGNLTYQAHTKSKPSENYATLRTQSLLSGPSLTRGNLRCTNTNSLFAQFESTLAATSGKWYAEVKVIDEGNNTLQVGAASHRTIHWTGSNNNVNGINAGYTIYNLDNDSAGNYANLYIDGSRPQTATNYKAIDGDVISMLLNLDDSEITFYKNNVIVDQARSITRDSDELTYFVAITRTNLGQGVLDWNFGQKQFTYSLPSGYKALATHNLPAITISPDDKEKPRDHFDIVTWTGNALRQDIKGLDFKPDLLITKNFTNSSSYHWVWVDSVRGIDKVLYSSLAPSVQASTTDSFTAFNSDGFSVGTNLDSQNAANITKSGYIAYAFKAGGDALLNELGTINSQVSANTTAGFSIATYTGVGYPASSTAEVGHGLSKAPELVIIKCTGGTGQSGGSTSWVVGNGVLPSNNWTGSYYLNSSNAYYTGNNYFWNGAATNSVVKLKNDWFVNGANNNYVMYSWHSVEGYSKIGTYTGNGNSNGPFVYTGFKPKFVMIKNADDTGSWIVHDTARETSNDMVNHLRFNTTGIEDDGANERIQMFSNGFKLIGAGQNVNHTDTYLYFAIAEDAAQYSQGTAKESGVEKFIDQTDQGTSGYPDEYFKAVTYKGNGAIQFIETGLKPGLSWIKKRTNDTKHHRFFDTVRGAGNAIYSPSTSGNTSEEGITTFNDNGFTLGSGGSTNENNDTFVSWNWRAGDTTVTKKPTYTSAGILTSNLVLHYNFAGNSYSGSGTTITDLANSNNLTTSGSPSWKTNAYGNYFSFDGSNDNATLSNASFLNSTSIITLEAWINYQGNSNSYGHVFGASNTGTTAVATGASIAIQNSNDELYFWYQGGGSERFTGYIVPQGEWIHVVGTISGDSAHMYVNGDLIHSHTLSSSLGFLNNSNNKVSLGDYSYNGNHHYKGFIGQARMYSSELTQAQIKTNYAATKTLYQGVGTTANVLQTNLELNYDFDDFDTYDTSWGANNKVAVFNGSSSVITLPSISQLPSNSNNTNNFTFSCWVKSTTTRLNNGGGSNPIFQNNNGSYQFIGFGGNDNGNFPAGRLFYYTYGGSGLHNSWVITSDSYADDQWHHFVVTDKYNSGSDNRTRTIYVDGIQKGQDTVDKHFLNSPATNPLIGDASGTGNRHADMDLDQVRIFNKAISAAEVKKLYSETQSQNNTLQILGDTSCIATYNFNVNYNDLSANNYHGVATSVTLADDAKITANRATDKTSNNNSGHIYGGLIKNNHVGKYVYLDGSNDYIKGPTASSIISSGTTDVTIEGWVYMKSHPSAYDGIIGVMNATSPFGGWMIYNHHPTDNYGFGVNVSGTWTSIDTRANIDLNVWTHVAATYDGSIMKFYKNGKLTLIHQVSGTIAYTSGILNFEIGRNATAYSDMNCAQARVYSATLSADQVKTNYDATKEQFYGALVHADVSVNDKSGFSIAKWTGTGVNGITIPHGMEKAPEVIFTKGLTNTTSWVSGLGGMTEYAPFDYMQLSTQGDISNSSTFYQAYKSTGFAAGVSSANEFNKNDSNEYISYCWRSVPGFSKIGIYTGTGTTNNIYIGFQPRWVMIKRSDSDNYWTIFDAARDNAGDMSKVLWANVHDVESDGGSTTSILTSATGFGMGSSVNGGSINANNGVYMYMAFA
jgi:hypothetical protein